MPLGKQLIRRKKEMEEGGKEDEGGLEGGRGEEEVPARMIAVGVSALSPSSTNQSIAIAPPSTHVIISLTKAEGKDERSMNRRTIRKKEEKNLEEKSWASTSFDM